MKTVAFLEAVEDITGGNFKVPRSEYRQSGQLPVVDQGKGLVSGYTDNTSHAFRHDGPNIIFGDHTRAMKYVDFPFAMGADGVKVLRTRGDFHPKFVYHYLRTVALPDAGYSRHFKFLKEIQVPRPPLEEQRRIAAILDRADALRTERRQVLSTFALLRESVFIDMFGHPSSNPHGLPTGTVMDLLESADYGTSEKSSQEGDIAVLRMNNITYVGEIDLKDLKYMDLPTDKYDRYTVRSGDVLFNRTNSAELVGKTAVYHGSAPLAYAGYLVRLRVREGFSPEYLSGVLNSAYGKATLRGMCKSIVGMANINAKEVQTIRTLIPPASDQQKYSERIEALRVARNRQAAALAELDELFAALQSRAFQGEL